MRAVRVVPGLSASQVVERCGSMGRSAAYVDGVRIQPGGSQAEFVVINSCRVVRRREVSRPTCAAIVLASTTVLSQERGHVVTYSGCTTCPSSA